MKSTSLKKFALALGLVLVAGSAAQASASPTCYTLQVNTLKDVARELGLPEKICVDSIRLNGKVVEIAGQGIPSQARADVRTKKGISRVHAMILSPAIDEGTCSRTASADIAISFTADARGEPVSALRISGVISDTSDNCHLNGESDFVEYVRN